MRLTDLKTHDQVLQASLQNSDFRREWERTALARTELDEVEKRRRKLFEEAAGEQAAGGDDDLADQ